MRPLFSQRRRPQGRRTITTPGALQIVLTATVAKPSSVTDYSFRRIVYDLTSAIG